MTALLWMLIPALPLALAAGSLLPRVQRFIPALAPLSVLPALWLSWKPMESVEIPWLLLGTRLGLEGGDRLFLLGSALLWGAAALYAGSYFRNDPRRERFFCFFLLTLAGNLGLFIAQDPASFYFFFALMTFSGYVLIVHSQTPAAARAGRIYLIAAVFGEICIASGLWFQISSLQEVNLILVTETSSTLSFYLLLLGFGVKAGLIPVHFWLPLAHPVAPTPASAVLSGAMINAGLVGCLRFLPEAGVGAGEWVLILGLSGAFWGALVGLLQRDPKTILAYSSISQMGWMLLTVSAIAFQPQMRGAAVSSAAFFALHHGLAKGALFLGTGMAGARKTPGGRLAWWVLLLIPALTLAGAPFSSGALAKTALKGVFAEIPGLDGKGLSLLLSLASIATVLVLGRFLYEARQLQGEKRPGRGEWFALLPILAALLLLPLFGIEDTRTYVSVSSLWPLLAGVGLLLLLGQAARRYPGLRTISVPPGDVVVPLEAAVKGWHVLWVRRILPPLGRARSWVYAVRWHEPHELRWLGRLMDRAGRLWGRWSLCGTLFLFVLLFTAWLAR